MRIQDSLSVSPAVREGSNGLRRFLDALRVGRVLRAELVEYVDGKEALIRLEGRLLSARCPPHLMPGEPFRVQITSTTPLIVLKILSSASEADAVLRQLLGRTLRLLGAEAARSLWAGALEEWRALDAGAPPGTHGALVSLMRHSLGPGSWDLGRYLHMSGLFLEPKLASLARGRPVEQAGPWPDLKAWLLRVLKSGGSDSRLDSTAGVLDLIRGCQSLMLLSGKGETSLHVPLILWGFPQGDWGDLRIRSERGGAGRSRRWSVAIRLNLSELGRILVNVSLLDRILSCRIRTSEPGTERLFRSKLGRLRDRLGGLGLGAVHLGCGHLDDRAEWDRPPCGLPDGLLRTRA